MPGVKEVESLDAYGRLRERTLVYPEYEAVAKRITRFDETRREREVVVQRRDGSWSRTFFNGEGDTVSEEYYSTNGALEKRVVYEYQGVDAIVITYDTDDREVSRTTQPRRTLL